jgi:hypothetical protein
MSPATSRPGAVLVASRERRRSSGQAGRREPAPAIRTASGCRPHCSTMAAAGERVRSDPGARRPASSSPPPVQHRQVDQPGAGEPEQPDER